jgi:hypothetical protein
VSEICPIDNWAAGPWIKNKTKIQKKSTFFFFFFFFFFPFFLFFFFFFPRSLLSAMGSSPSKLEKALGANIPDTERYFGLENVCVDWVPSSLCAAVVTVFVFVFPEFSE